MTTIAKRTIKLPYSVNHTTDNINFYLCRIQSKSRVQQYLLSALSIPGETEMSVPPPSFQPHGRNLISSKTGLQRAPETLSRDILSRTILRSLTVIKSNVVYPSRTTVLQLDCTPSALTAREARDPRKNPSNTDFSEPTSYSTCNSCEQKEDVAKQLRVM